MREVRVEVGLPRCRQRLAEPWRPAQSWRRAGDLIVADGAYFLEMSECTMFAGD